MSRLRRLLPLIAIGALACVASWGISGQLPRSSPGGAETPLATTPEPTATARARLLERPAGPLRWIVAGGGPSPALSQIQIEYDLELARDALAPSGPGILLLSAGPGWAAVGADDPAPPTLRQRVAELFDPRPGRDLLYHLPALDHHGAATAEELVQTLEREIIEGEAPLTVYLGGHGTGGDVRSEARVLMWGGRDLWASDLALVLDESPGHRTARFVIASCYSGGFAELAFDNADALAGAATTDRCGLFATSWDRVAAGCDPNPDRGSHEGYSVHFLHALGDEDRESDIDADGEVSLLEAHTYARIHSRSLDLPTTTSERFLRVAAEALAVPDRPDARADELVEELAVIAALGAELGAADEEEASAQVQELFDQIDALSGPLDAIVESIETLDAELAAELLARWPTLDDPWHPRFEETFDAAAIETFLDHSDAARRRAELHEEHEELAGRHDALMIEAAPYERLLRAYETVRLAAKLAEHDPSAYARYRRFVACERGAVSRSRD